MTFEYDEVKAALNVQNHDGVEFSEAASLFHSHLTVFKDDTQHSWSEKREIAIGESNKGRLLFVSFVERTQVSDPCPRIRIISARKATRKERSDYDLARR